MFGPSNDRRAPAAVPCALALIAIAGSAMRLYGLSFQSLWFDEVCSWHTATRPTFAGIWSGDVQWNMYPPLYGFVLRAAIILLGSSEWALRLPSALAGIAAIPLMYLVGARIYGRAEGLLAAGSTALSMFPLYFAQEARPYALLLCAVLAAVWTWTYVYDAWANARPAPRAALATCFAASVCASYLHYFGLLFVALHGVTALALLARTRYGLTRALAFYSAAALAFAPWLPFMAWHLKHQSEGPQNPPIDANAAVSFWQYVDSLFNHGQTGSYLASAVTGAALLSIAIAFADDVLRPKRGDTLGPSPQERLVRAAVLAAWLLLPFLIAYAKSSVSASVFTHRNLIVSLPAVYLLAARGIARLPVPRTALAVIGIVVLSGFMVRTVTSGYYSAPHKDQLREAVAVVKQHEAQYPDAALVVYANLPFTFDYYIGRLGATLRPTLVAGTGGQIDAMRAFVRERKPAAIWYLCTDPNPDPPFVVYLNTEFTILRLERFLRADVMLLVPK